MTVPQRLILFAHGAGASSSSAWMQAWKERLAAVGRVVTFDYPYMSAGRRRPDLLPALIRAHGAALDSAGAGQGEPVLLAGKSMGSRVGCHLALERPVAGLVCFGYPLRAAGSGKLRDAVLLELETPVLFLTGTRDELCPLGELARVRAQMKCPSELVVVEGGDHSLLLTKTELKRQGLIQAEVDARLLAAVQNFAERLTS